MKTSTQNRTSTAKAPRTREVPARKNARDLALKRILVPVDFSPASLKAVGYACALAKESSANVHLVHVNDIQFEQPVLLPLFSQDKDFGHKLRRKLQWIAAKCEKPISSARCHIRTGKAFAQICEEAKKERADLIVTSTHGYTGLKHMLIGSTAERIVRHAPCPVLVVREHEQEFLHQDKGDGGRFTFAMNQIVVPVDFSAHSREALRYAVRWAKRFGAALTLVHSVYPHYYATNTDYSALDYPELLETMREGAENDMRKLTRETSFGGVPFVTKIVTGFPGRELPELASQIGADLIVTSTHGRTGLKRALIGSTAEQIVRVAACPVLVVPAFAAAS